MSEVMQHLVPVPSDLRFACRALRRRPVLSLTAVLTLTLGLSCATLMFSLTYDVLLRRLPYPAPGQLVQVQEDLETGNSLGLVSPKNLVDWRARTPRNIRDLSVYYSNTEIISTSQAGIRAEYLTVPCGFLETLGARTSLGRLFSDSEYRSANPAEPTIAHWVLLSHSFWIDVLEGRRDIVGQQIQVGGRPATVIGVLAATVSLAVFQREGLEPQIIHPVDLETLAQRFRHRTPTYFAMGRLAPGADRQGASAELTRIASRVARETGDPEAQVQVVAVPLLDPVVGDSGDILLLLGVATGLLFLISCSNVGTLLLIRTQRRILEIGVRRALGAGYSRIGSLILAETTVIVVLGCTASLLLTGLSYRFLAGMASLHLPRLQDASIHWPTFFFAAAVSFLMLLLTGLAPLTVALRKQIRDCLSDNATTSQSRIRASRVAIVG